MIAIIKIIVTKLVILNMTKIITRSDRIRRKQVDRLQEIHNCGASSLRHLGLF